MTSSYKATATPSVRQAPPGGHGETGEWSLKDLGQGLVAPQQTGAPTAQPAAQIDAAEIERIADEAYQRGLADGEARAAVNAQHQLQNALSTISRAVALVEEFATVAPPVLEENVAALAVIVARQIVAREVSTDRELVADLVRRALTEFPVDHGVRIRVHPLDLALLTTSTTSGESSPITGTRDASWLADSRVARGGCLIEGRDRIIDGRVDAALERAYRRMAAIDAS